MDKLTKWFDPQNPAWSLVGVAVALAGALILYRFIANAVTRWSRRTGTQVDDVALRQLRRPLFCLLPVASLGFALPLLRWSEANLVALRQAHTVLVILLVAWLAIRMLTVIEAVVRQRFDATVSDNLQARAVHTQVRAFRNIVSFVIGLLAVAFVLMTFDRIRQLGVGLLASAGVAGMAIGFAAQRSVAAVIAGIQVALTQPVRVDDVVIMVHGSLVSRDAYILSMKEVERNRKCMLEEFKGMRICFFAHTHVPMLIGMKKMVTELRETKAFQLDPSDICLVNPGSVGQPRDRCPLASFGIFDTDNWTMTFFRLPYDVAGAQQAITAAGLPEKFARRLELGV